MRSMVVSGVCGAVRAADDALGAALTGGAEVAGVGQIRHDELTDLVATLTRVQARTDALLLAAVGEIDARGTHSLDGALTRGRGCARWPTTLRATLLARCARRGCCAPGCCRTPLRHSRPARCPAGTPR